MLEAIIKTVLGKSDEEYFKYIDYLQSPEREKILQDTEKDMIAYLAGTYKTAGKFPTEEFFLTQYPEYTIPLKSAKELSLHDLDIQYKKMIEVRSQQVISRDIMKIASEISQEGFSDEKFEKLRELYNLNRTVELDETAFDIGSFREIYERKKDQPIGLLTYIKEVDKIIGGLSYGTVNVIFADTASFKTTFALNIAYNNSYKLGYNVVIISLEVPKEDIMCNLLCRHSFDIKFSKYPYIPHDKIRKCLLDDEEEDYLFNTVLVDLEQNSEGKLVILDESDFVNFTFPEIRSKLEEIDRRIGGIDAIIWDHANLFKFSEGQDMRMSQNEIINKYVSWIRQLSIKWLKDPDTGQFRKLCNIIIAQANRDGVRRATKNGGRYDLRAIAEANELERAAYRVFSLYTNEDLKQSKECLIQILKNRSGPTMYEPLSIFADPEAYVVGDEMDGFNDMLDTDSFSDVFADDEFDIGF